MSGLVSAASTAPCWITIVALGLTMLSMSVDQECLGIESCRPETVTCTARTQACQPVCCKRMLGPSIKHLSK